MDMSSIPQIWILNYSWSALNLHLHYLLFLLNFNIAFQLKKVICVRLLGEFKIVNKNTPSRTKVRGGYFLPISPLNFSFLSLIFSPALTSELSPSYPLSLPIPPLPIELPNVRTMSGNFVVAPAPSLASQSQNRNKLRIYTKTKKQNITDWKL